MDPAEPAARAGVRRALQPFVLLPQRPPEVLEVREAPDPRAGVGQVRIRARGTASTSPTSWRGSASIPTRREPPCVVGYEVAGVVDAVGEGVAGIAVGARVAAATRFGGYADRSSCPRAAPFAVPERVRLETAAALPVNYLTAWLMLVQLANVRAGERVLVHAAAGGVGLAAVQLCRWRGAEILATASRRSTTAARDGRRPLHRLRAEDFEAAVRASRTGRGVDLVLDALGGASFRKSYRCLAPLGRLSVRRLQPGAAPHTSPARVLLAWLACRAFAPPRS